MIPALKSELRKLITVRSTYANIVICLLIVGLFAGFGSGFRGAAADLRNPRYLATQSTDALVFVGLIFAFVGLLLAANEYRYTTIMYTLTSVNRRLKVLATKFVIITLFAVLASVLIMFFSPLCTIVGAHLAGKHISPQTFDLWPVLWRCVLSGWGYSMYAFILLLIMRNQVGAIITFLLVPLVGENILIQLFKHIGNNLPFTAVQAVAEPNGLGNHASSGHEALIVVAYVVVGLIVSAILFLRRDAN